MLEMQTLFNIYFWVFVGIIGNTIIGWEIGRKGLIQLGLEGPRNLRVVFAMSLWLIAIAWGMVSKVQGQLVQLPTSPHPFWFLLWGVVMVFLGHFSIQKSQFLFNTAKALHEYWGRLYYTPGKTGDPQKSAALRNFPKVQEAEKLYKEAIKLEEQGTLIRSVEKTVAIKEDELNYYGYIRNVNCPVCGIQNYLSHWEYKTTFICNLCEHIVFVKQEGDNILLWARVRKKEAIRRPILRNRINAAIGYQQLGLLYRIQERWDDAIDALHKSQNMSKELNSEYPEDKEILMALGTAIFRLGEIDHAQGRYKEAKRKYKESLEIDKKLDNEEGIRTINILLDQIEKEE